MLKKGAKRGYKNRKVLGEFAIDKKDMQRRFASAGPNKQMYEMYNLSIKNSAINEPISFYVTDGKSPDNDTQYQKTTQEAFNLVSNQNSKSQ